MEDDEPVENVAAQSQSQVSPVQTKTIDMPMDVVDTGEITTGKCPMNDGDTTNISTTEVSALRVEVEDNVKKKVNDDAQEIREVVDGMEEEISRIESTVNLDHDAIDHSSKFKENPRSLEELCESLDVNKEENVEKCELEDGYEASNNSDSEESDFNSETKNLPVRDEASSSSSAVVLSAVSRRTRSHITDSDREDARFSKTKDNLEPDLDDSSSDVSGKNKIEVAEDEDSSDEKEKTTKKTDPSLYEYFESNRKKKPEPPEPDEIPTLQQIYMQEQLRDFCVKQLRSLELNAYSECINALRAGGKLNDTKRNLLEKLRDVFRIPVERHQAEVRRVLANEELAVIADNATGEKSTTDWKKEGYSNYHIEPKILSYNTTPDNKPYFVLSTVKIKHDPLDLFPKIKPTGDISSPHCIESNVQPGEIVGSSMRVSDRQKISLSVPPDIQLNIKTQNLSEEDEKENEAGVNNEECEEDQSKLKKRKGRTTSAGNETKKRKVSVRKSQTSPDITSSPSKSEATSTKPSPKRKRSQPKPSSKTKPTKMTKKSAKAKGEQRSEENDTTKRSTSAEHFSESNDEDNLTEANKAKRETEVIPGHSAGAVGPAIPTGPVRPRGGIRRVGRASNNGVKIQRKLSVPRIPSLETNEEMPSSPQLETLPKPKRKVLKVKKPRIKNEQIAKPVKQKRKKAEQSQRIEQNLNKNVPGEERPVNKRKQNLDKLNTDAPIPVSSKPPAKMRHKAKQVIRNENESESGGYLPRYNFNEELQSQLKTTVASKSPPPSVGSRVPPPVFSTSLNYNNFHKKRTQLLLPSTYQSLGPDEPSSASASSESGTTAQPSLTTASSLARIRPSVSPAIAISSASSVLFEQQLRHGLLSGNSSSIGGVTGNGNPLTSLTSLMRHSSVLGTSVPPLSAPPPIMHRKGVPHILAKRNLTSHSTVGSSIASASAIINVNSMHSNAINSSNSTSLTASSLLVASTSSSNSCSRSNTITTLSTSPPMSGSMLSTSDLEVTITNANETVQDPPMQSNVLSSDVLEEKQNVEPQLQQQSGFLVATECTTSMANEGNFSSTPIVTATSSIPLGSVGSPVNFARMPQPPNVIFLQKPLPMGNLPSASPVVVSSTSLASAGLPPGMQVPLRSTSRAVIVRRTTNTATPQGNVVILDVHKNQLLNANPPFLQATRLLNTHPGLTGSTLLNASPNVNTPSKIIHTGAGSLVSSIPIRFIPPTATNVPHQQQALSPRKPRAISPSPAPSVLKSGQQIPTLKPLMAIRPATSINSRATSPIKFVVQSTSAGPGQPPPLQVVQRLVKGYSNPMEIPQVELNGSPGLRIQSVSPDSIENNIKISNVTSISNPDTSATSGWVTSTSEEAYTTINNSGYENYIPVTPQATLECALDGSTIPNSDGEDIFQLALKSSGLDFAQHNIFVTEPGSSREEVDLPTSVQTGIQVAVSSGADSSQN